MSDVLALARPELRKLRPYVPGDYEPGTLRLNANESPWRAPGDTTVRGLNRYPPPRPTELNARLSDYYDVAANELLVTRGSSEAIDVLIRTFCAAGRDRILICPPTFDMYRVYAEIQAAGIERVPLKRDSDERADFTLDVDTIVAKLGSDLKVIFVCTPNNPTGTSAARADVTKICEASEGSAIVVIDEAYREFSSKADFRELQERFEHVVLLRTLSKFVSLAGVRCGAVIGHPAVIELLGAVLPPYTFPTPSIEHVAQAMQSDSMEIAAERIATLRAERERLSEALRDIPGIERLWPSDANFVLVRTRPDFDLAARAKRAGILVRVFANDPTLEHCVRISVGTPDDNNRLIAALTERDPT
jgi:histidinol-phosphate aminotransferase